MSENNKNVQSEAETDRKLYRDKEWFEQKYVEEDLTYAEIAELVSVNASTLSRWAQRHGLNERQRDFDLSDVEIPEERPYADEELMRELYLEKGMSQNDIAIALDCSSGSVSTWLDKHDIETRDMSVAASYARGNEGIVPYELDKWGTPTWKHSHNRVQVHRLIAVAEFGLDEIEGKHVHHKSGIRWDNRPENLEIMGVSEHMEHHKKIDGLDRIRIAELYENGDASQRDLVEILDYDITQNTIRNIHREFYGGEAS